MVSLDQMIVVTPGTAGGKPRINGTGVTVGRIALLATGEGLTPQQIVDEVYTDYLTLAQVYGALAYYYLNREAIDTQLAKDLAEGLRLEAEHSRTNAR